MRIKVKLAASMLVCLSATRQSRELPAKAIIAINVRIKTRVAVTVFYFLLFGFRFLLLPMSDPDGSCRAASCTGIVRMTLKFLLASVFVFLATMVAEAGALQRIGHTTLTPRNSNPDDKGMYASIIDPVNGYAYFVGNYLFKLDITGPLPVPVGSPLSTGQFACAAIDVAAGYAYFPGASMKRYALGAGAAPVTAAGTLTLSAGAASCFVIDDSDANPANHYLYA